MPVKVRCPDCSKVLNAPDRARGKAVRCPECQARVPVPTGKQKKKKPQNPAESSSFLQGLDIGRMQHKNERVCPKCAGDVEPEDIECPACGVNLETGKLSVEQKFERERVGPDPGDYYGRAWSSSWKFFQKNIRLAVRTGIYWTILGFLFYAFFSGALSCKTWPPYCFWMTLAVLMLIAIPGWQWYLTTLVVQNTMDKRAKLRDLQFDPEKCSALGIKAFVWSIALMTPGFLVTIPIVLLLSALGFPILSDIGEFVGRIGIDEDNRITGFVELLTLIGVYCLPLTLFPIGIAHMSMKLSYRAWLPIDMTVLFFRNLGPALYWWVMALGVMWPVLLGAGLIGYFFVDIFFFLQIDVIEKSAMFLAKLVAVESDTDSGTYIAFWYPVAGIVFFVVISLFTFPSAFPATFLARTNGLFTYYNQENLGLVFATSEGEIARFWVRYLAWLIDMIVIAVMLGLIWGIWGVIWYIAVSRFEMDAVRYPLIGLGIIVSVFAHYKYYVRSESGNSQGTLGKNTLGLVVTDLEGNKLDIKMIRARWFIRTFMTPVVPLYLGFLMVCFTEKKQTLHDAITHSYVTWEGEKD